jgi:hypothetical protein
MSAALTSGIFGTLILAMLAWVIAELHRLNDRIDRLVDRVDTLAERVSRIEGRLDERAQP